MDDCFWHGCADPPSRPNAGNNYLPGEAVEIGGSVQ